MKKPIAAVSMKKQDFKIKAKDCREKRIEEKKSKPEFFGISVLSNAELYVFNRYMSITTVIS